VVAVVVVVIEVEVVVIEVEVVAAHLNLSKLQVVGQVGPLTSALTLVAPPLPALAKPGMLATYLSLPAAPLMPALTEVHPLPALTELHPVLPTMVGLLPHLWLQALQP